MGQDEAVLYANTGKLLPHTDPFNRQITIGLGCLLEVMRMAAAEQGYRVETELFPQGENETALDGRPVARAVFRADPVVTRDPLFAHVLHRRSVKEPFDTLRLGQPDALAVLSAATVHGTRFGGIVEIANVASLRALSHEALRIEIETPRTYQESVGLFRIGHRHMDANPDDIDFSGSLFETLRLLGLLTRQSALGTTSSTFKAGAEAVFANIDTATGHV
jgi:hypothetical protein